MPDFSPSGVGEKNCRRPLICGIRYNDRSDRDRGARRGPVRKIRFGDDKKKNRYTYRQGDTRVVNQDPKYRMPSAARRLSASALAFAAALSAAGAAAAYGVRVEGLEGEGCRQRRSHARACGARAPRSCCARPGAPKLTTRRPCAAGAGLLPVQNQLSLGKKNPNKGDASVQNGEGKGKGVGAEGTAAPAGEESAPSADKAPQGLTGMTLTYDRPRQSGDEEALAARNRSADAVLVDPKLNVAHAEDADGTGEESLRGTMRGNFHVLSGCSDFRLPTLRVRA